jgi:hypothetical protein
MSDFLRCYDYVNQPYARVRDALIANPNYVFRHATAADTTQAARLHVRLLGALDVGAEVTIYITGVADDSAYGRVATKIGLMWEATNHPNVFPSLTGTLAIFALSPTETQLELEARYAPPGGIAGQAFDAAVGHKLAEASVNTFVKEVAGWLREELATRNAESAIEELTSAVPDRSVAPGARP